MSGRTIVQEYGPNRLGPRIPTHTKGLKGCRCTGCCQRRWWTPEQKAARSGEIRRQYADGRRVWSPNANLKRASHWLSEHDALLRDLVGKHDIPTIAAKLTERFGLPRTESSVKHRIQRLGILILDHRPYTTSEAARMLGMSRNNLLEIYVRPGLLRCVRWRGGQHGMFVYNHADLERFVREHHERLNVPAMRDSGLRALAIALSRGSRLVGTREVLKLTGVSRFVQHGLYEAGLVPSARRIRRRGAGRSGGWMIDASDLEAVRTLAAEREARRFDRPRDPLTGRILGPGILDPEGAATEVAS